MESGQKLLMNFLVAVLGSAQSILASVATIAISVRQAWCYDAMH